MENKGKAIMIFDGSTTVALATNHELTIKPKIDETKTKDDALGPVGTFDYSEWDATCDSIMTPDIHTGQENFSDLIDKQLAGTRLNLVMDAVEPATADDEVPVDGWVRDSDATNFVSLSGYAYISELSITADEEGDAKVSVSFVGDSELSLPA